MNNFFQDADALAITTTREPRGNVLPVYFVADESGSMASVIDEVNDGLSTLLEALEFQPMAASKVRFAVLGFNNQAYEVLPMCDLREVDAIDQMRAGGGTSYAAAFRLLRTGIERDVSSLKADGFSVHRPAVFFLSDGYPNSGDAWDEALAELTSPAFACHPNIIAFGMGEADVAVIARVATSARFAFLHAGEGDLGVAVADFMEALTHSVIASGSSVAMGGPLRIEKPAGFIEIETDVI